MHADNTVRQTSRQRRRHAYIQAICRDCTYPKHKVRTSSTAEEGVKNGVMKLFSHLTSVFKCQNVRFGSRIIHKRVLAKAEVRVCQQTRAFPVDIVTLHIKVFTVDDVQIEQ